MCGTPPAHRRGPHPKAKELSVQLPPAKVPVEFGGVDAHHHPPEARLEKLLCQHPCVASPHGHTPFFPDAAKRSSRYFRTSSKNRSPKAYLSQSRIFGEDSASAIRSSYSSFGHDGGILTSTSGRPIAAACCRRRPTRTPCMLIRSYSSVTVVRSARTCSSSRRNDQSVRAESLPPLQDRTTAPFAESVVGMLNRVCELRSAEHLLHRGGGRREPPHRGRHAGRAD